MISKSLQVIALVVFLSGCETIELSGFKHAEILQTGIRAVSSAARPISEKEEYFVGRAVAARLIAEFGLHKNDRLTEYVSLVGQTVAMHSDKPFTYAGYRFALLASDTINAFACPGGLIFITKGMLDSIQSEDELAAVLAHEVAHISHGDGISSIKKSRWVEAVQVIGLKAAEEYGSRELSTLVRVFEGSIEDVFKTLVVNGYGRKQEFNADSSSLIYLDRAGYYPHALNSFVERVLQNDSSSKGGLLQTHPATAERRKNILANLPKKEISSAAHTKRSKRFKRRYN